MRERVQPVLVGPRADDLAVVRLGRVQVVVVIVETRRFEAFGLRTGQHAERDAGLQPEHLHLGHELGHLVEVPIPGRTPGRSHAEARRTGRLRLECLGAHRLLRHEPLRLDAGREMGVCGQYAQSSGQPPVLIESSVEIWTSFASKVPRWIVWA